MVGCSGCKTSVPHTVCWNLIIGTQLTGCSHAVLPAKCRRYSADLAMPVAWNWADQLFCFLASLYRVTPIRFIKPHIGNCISMQTSTDSPEETAALIKV